MHAETFIEQETEANAKLRLFSLYMDLGAAVRARWAGSTITGLVSPHWRASSEMWTLDFYQSHQSLKGMMLQGAAEADVLIVALTSLDQQETKLIEWLDAVADRKSQRSGPGLFIGLLGDESQEAGELRWTVKHFMRCAQRMGRDFIWQWMEQEATNDHTWLTDNVEKFLLRKQYLANMAWLQETAASVNQLAMSETRSLCQA